MIDVLNFDLLNFNFMKKIFKLFVWYFILGCGVFNKVLGEWGFVFG